MNNDQTLLFVDCWWTFVLPLICLCSMVTNALSVAILHRLRRINRLYELLYVKTCINLVHLVIGFGIFVTKCGYFCPVTMRAGWPAFLVQVYTFYVHGYVGNVLAYSDFLVEVIISVERFVMLNNDSTFRMNLNRPTTQLTTPTLVKQKQSRSTPFVGVRFSLVCFVSLLVYSPSLFFAKIERTNLSRSISLDSDVAMSWRLQVANVHLYEHVETLTTVFMRSLPTLLLVVFINVTNLYHIRQKMKTVAVYRVDNPSIKSRRLISRAEQTNVKFKRMLFYQSLTFVLGNSFFIFGYVFVLVWPRAANERNVNVEIDFPLIPLVCHTLMFASLGLNYFLWIRFDQRFRQAFDGLISMTDSTRPDKTKMLS